MSIQASGTATMVREGSVPSLDLLLDAAARGEAIEDEHAAVLASAVNGFARCRRRIA